MEWRWSECPAPPATAAVTAMPAQSGAANENTANFKISSRSFACTGLKFLLRASRVAARVDMNPQICDSDSDTNPAKS